MIPSNVKRSFIIGDEWLYFKLYSGPKTLEYILKNELYALAKLLLKKQAIDKFFFIKYEDPDYHLRIRFHIPNESNITEVLLLLKESIIYYVEKRMIWKVTVDTYNRELERYGKDTILDIESLFYYDSQLTLEYITSAENNENDRWLFAAKYIDTMMDKFNLPIKGKINFCEKIIVGFSSEFNMNKNLKIQLDNKYRKEAKKIELVLDQQAVNSYKLINEYFNSSESIIYKILLLSKNNLLEVPLEQLLNSIIHMHINRLFRTKQRLNEFVVYYLLFKYYISYSAKLKHNVKGSIHENFS